MAWRLHHEQICATNSDLVSMKEHLRPDAAKIALKKLPKCVFFYKMP